MPLARVLLVLLLLPALFGLERLAYYAARSFTVLHFMRGLGMSQVDAASLMRGFGILSAFVPLIGGLFALATGPAPMLVAGAVLSAAGYGLLAAASSTPLAWIGLLVLAVGQGLIRPSVLALVANALPHPREHLRSLGCVLVYAAANAGALVGPGLAGLAQSAGTTAVMASSAGVSVVVIVLAVALLVVELVTRRARPDPSPTVSGLRLRSLLLGALLLLILLVPYNAALSLGSSLEFDLLWSASSTRTTAGAVTSVNPVGVLLAGALLVPLLLVLHFKDLKLSAWYAVGVGSSVVALAATPLLLAKLWSGAAGAATAGVAVASFATGLGEILVTPFAMSRIAGDLPARWTTLVVAVVQVVVTGTSLLMSLIPRGSALGWPVLAVLSVLLLVLGVATVVAAGPLGRRLYAVDPPLERASAA